MPTRALTGAQGCKNVGKGLEKSVKVSNARMQLIQVLGPQKTLLGDS